LYRQKPLYILKCKDFLKELDVLSNLHEYYTMQLQRIELMSFYHQHIKKRCTLFALIIQIISFMISSVVSGPIASGKNKFLGNVTGSSVPADFSDYWNQITPENSGKWGVVEPKKDEMNWEGVQKSYDFAMQNGFPFKQHTFIWAGRTAMDKIAHARRTES
jgi:GH35 family endo-1,4-beta-xylanase